jgi:molybdenum-dependent DNA-binding transcriptional regulator ModE
MRTDQIHRHGGDGIKEVEMKTLKEFVKACGSQEQAAKSLGVPLNNIWRWMNGRGISRVSLALLESKGIILK